MATISQRELRNQSAAIMDRVERGESFEVTRNGRPVAELRPIGGRRPHVPAEQLRAALRRHGHLDYAAMRQEADDFYGDDGVRIG